MLFHRTAVRAAAFVLCAGLLGVSASADGGDAAVFAPDLTGICITSVPEEGAVRLGSRVIRRGDVLTADQAQALTFSCPEREYDIQAVMEYLPVGPEGIGAEAELVFNLRGKKNDAPAAEDSRLETYKNLPNEGMLSCTDPEGDTLTFTLTRAPKRGEVILREDGSFLYTPKKNKVGTDSFTFTATDSAGNVSKEATVTIDILKPSDERQYTDTVASDCRFQAEWLRSTGIFSGETVNGQLCFSPEEPVSRGQFLAMLMQVLDLPVDRSAAQTGFVDEAPQWLRPYLAAALRSGIITGYPAENGVEFRAEQTVSAAEAQMMVSRAVSFVLPAAAMDNAPALSGTDALTRADAAKALYHVSLLRRDSGLLGLFR